MSIDAQKRYINLSNGRINTNVLKKDSEPLPSRHRNWKDFKISFGGVNHYNYEFYGFKIYINVRYAFDHFKKNTYNEHRENINATIIPTLHDPLIVIKENYEGKNTLTFYKPFVNDEDILHIAMHKAVENEDGIYIFKTIFELHSLDKVEKIIKTLDLNTVYFKY